MSADSRLSADLKPCIAAAAARARGEVALDEPMGRHCTWRAGGRAACLFRPVDLDDLDTFLAALPVKVPVAFIGLGSNLLVREGGFDGVLVATNQALGAVRRATEDTFIAGAGLPCAKLAREAARAGFADAAFLAGIPGTIGGALAQNAGAFGGETWSYVEAVTTIDRRGTVRECMPAVFQVEYRSVSAPAEGWFLGGTFRFGPESDPKAEHRIRELIARRAASQPTGQASCGSVFRNPEGDHAGRLIEAAGLKGRRIGGAVVSPEHANFIINDAKASANDIEALMQTVAREVAARFGVALVPEVTIIGRHVQGAHAQ